MKYQQLRYMKQRVTLEDGIELSTICRQFKMTL